MIRAFLAAHPLCEPLIYGAVIAILAGLSLSSPQPLPHEAVSPDGSFLEASR
jgi:hypothetical protein